MMVERIRLKQAIALVCLCGSLGFGGVHGQNLSKFDLSTDDGVNAAREAIAGKRLDGNSKRCVRRNNSIPGIIPVGGFAYDRGCRLQGVFVNSHYLTTDDKAFSRTALNALGWNRGDRSQRETAAQAWVANGLLAFFTVISVKDADFANHSFQPPQTSTRADGTVTVTLWVRLPAGRIPGTRYELREYILSNDGDLADNTTLDTFTAFRN